MKKFLPVYIIIIAGLFACNTEENHDFTVSGTIKNKPVPVVFLEKLAYENAPAQTIDSAVIAEDGSFTLKGKDTQENLYVLSFNHQPAVIFVNDGDNINLDFDLQNFATPTVKGSAATEKLYAFIEDYRQRDSVLSNLYNSAEELHNLGGQEEALNSLQASGQSQINELNLFLEKEIKDAKSPAVAAFILDKAAATNEPQKLIAWGKEVDAKFPGHGGITSFNAALAKVNESNTDAAGNEAVGGAAGSLLNQNAPNLTMPDVNGKAMSITDFKGKYVLVDFWASWCAPCRQENPNIVKAYNKYNNKNFTILGVSLDANKDAWLKAIEKDNLKWNHMSDLKQWESDAVNAYQIEGIPFNVLVDPNGKIIAKDLRGDELDKKLAEVLK